MATRKRKEGAARKPMNIPSETRMELAFQAAAEIDMLLPRIIEGLEELRMDPEILVPLVLLDKLRFVSRALVNITQPDCDDEHDFEKLRAKLRFGGFVGLPGAEGRVERPPRVSTTPGEG